MKLPLAQGSYLARGVIANAQSCINLYPEPNPPDAPFPMTHYPAPGLSIAADYTGMLTGFVRGLYFTSNGRPVAVVGQSVIRMITGSGESPAQYVLLGTLPTNSGIPVVMCDNQTDLVLVDGTPGGWYVPLAQIDTPGSMQTISDPAWYGSNRVDFIDTFLIFNWPGTPTWYSTTSNVLLPFDAQYFAAKEGYNDLLVCVAALHDNVWVLGAETAEIWYNAGASLFPFARMPNSVLQQGCAAAYSVTIADNAIYWLSQDRWGRSMLIRGEGYGARRVSTFAVENEWSTYPTIADAVGMAYQIGGHETIGLYFPSGNAWWAFDASTQLFHKRTYGDTVTPWLPYCMSGWGETPYVNYVNAIIAGDRTAPRVYRLDRNNYTDNGTPIQRQRSWMHVVADGKRQVHSRFSLHMNGANLTPNDQVTLTWSDNGAQSWNAPVTQTMNNQTNGQYQWRRLGYARDRVYQLNWSAQGECALNGAWIDVLPEMT